MEIPWLQLHPPRSRHVDLRGVFVGSHGGRLFVQSENEEANENALVAGFSNHQGVPALSLSWAPGRGLVERRRRKNIVGGGGSRGEDVGGE